MSKNKMNKVVTDMQKKIALAVLDEIEELINTGVFYNSGWDEPELMKDMGFRFDDDDLLGGIELAREYING
jgi:hypothetical protein